MGADDKPGSKSSSPTKEDKDQSSPSIEELDSAWADEGEEFDEDATRVAKIPMDLVALSRRGNELEAKAKPEPEKNDAITARPPPPAAGEALVVVDAPHQTVPRIQIEDDEPARDDAAGGDEDEDDEDLDADDLDAGWDVEEERAAAADVAAGLDVEARRKAAEARAILRREKLRAKKLAAKEKRKARADSIKLKQKKPKKRSIPPPREGAREGREGAVAKAVDADLADSTARERPTIPPKEGRAPLAAPAQSGMKRDVTRMVLFVAIIVVLGALVIGLMRR